MKKIIHLSIAILVVSQLGFAQIKSASRAYNALDFQKTIEVYESKLESKKLKAIDYKHLANAYYNNSDYKNAVENYSKFFELEKGSFLQERYKYAQSLKSVGEYKKAEQILEEIDSQSYSVFYSNDNYLEEIKANSGQYEIENLNINTNYSDFSSGIYKQKMIFASAKPKSALSKNIHSWTGESFLDLFETNLDGSNVNRLSKTVNSKFHESSSSISKDGLTMYFTRNNVVKNKALVNKDGITLLKIYRVTRSSENDKWSNLEELPFNSNEYSVAHPALSPDGRTLYFVSDMPGGLGMSDLYKVSITKDGFGTPENLREINTFQRETFPFVSESNELFFTSDGHAGLGGLDVFKYNLSDRKVSNLGLPINSPEDDFAYVSRADGTGYFSSNRHGGKGNDDIYAFTRLIPEHKCDHELLVVVFDKESGIPITNAMVNIDGLKEIQTELYTSRNGEVHKPLMCVANLKLQAHKEGYEPGFGSALITKESTGQTKVIIELEPKEIITKGEDVFVNINPIYFDFDKWNIRPDAAEELDKVIAVMQKYPQIIIESGSHTDSRGSDQYNVKLSSKRAQSTLDYIISNGIDANRISGKGHGEKQLTNTCSNGVKCSKAEHQANRRTEFIILNPEVIKK
ncbi:MAG: OmpA family protein [Flavobacteriales bacterium]